ncbi:hypothetical protein EBT25_15110 [bacterium]|nr:hypothetical protein [bacterium]
MTLAPCPTHGSTFRALHEHNFRGIVEVIEQLLDTVSGVGTTSYSRCAVGYPWNFEGVVRALEDLNTTISGIQTSIPLDIQAGSGIFFTASGTATVINATVTSASGAIFTAGSGLYLVNGTQFNVNYGNVFQNSVSGHVFGQGSNTVTYSGNNVIISGAGGGSPVTVSGSPGTNYNPGSLWFDTNQGRLFVYASGNGVSAPSWYQTNTDAVVLKGDVAPSGTGTDAPARDGSLWFNTLVGNLFVYDAMSSGWYEAGPSRSFAYSATAPAPPAAQGAGWYDTINQHLFVWNGTSWNQV